LDKEGEIDTERDIFEKYTWTVAGVAEMYSIYSRV
jgi:hypothetical protein